MPQRVRAISRNRNGTYRTIGTLVVLTALAAGLGVLAFRPTRTSLWPSRSEEWLSHRHGAVGLDEPPHR